MTRSKTLITLLNRLGFCISYESLERIESALSEQIISNLPRGHRVPIDKARLTQHDPINAAIDNFDSADSHGTILIIFQNQQTGVSPSSSQEISKLPPGQLSRERAAKSLVPCQERVHMGPIRERGSFAEDFMPTSYIDYDTSEIKQDFLMWLLVRQRKTTAITSIPGTTLTHYVPSFTATRAVLPTCRKREVTATMYTPILPYPIYMN